jgi:hypothetical protein
MRFDDDSNPRSGFGWMCSLVDAGVLQAAAFRARPQAALAALIGGSCYECRGRAAALARAVATSSLNPSIPAAGLNRKPGVG